MSPILFYVHRVALSHSSSADSISDAHGPGTDDTHNISQWREVLPGEEIPFEFEARDKLRHRCVWLTSGFSCRAIKYLDILSISFIVTLEVFVL